MLSSFESRVPPPIVASGIAALMAWVFHGGTRFQPGVGADLVFTSLLHGSWLIALTAILSMRKARTTINPMHPERTTTLITTGVYRRSRNPLYLSLLCLLIAYSMYLVHPGALLGPLVFLIYVTRFHIVPEERALEARFGAEYRAYRQRVRRWI